MSGRPTKQPVKILTYDQLLAEGKRVLDLVYQAFDGDLDDFYGATERVVSKLLKTVTDTDLLGYFISLPELLDAETHLYSSTNNYFKPRVVMHGALRWKLKKDLGDYMGELRSKKTKGIKEVEQGKDIYSEDAEYCYDCEDHH